MKKLLFALVATFAFSLADGQTTALPKDWIELKYGFLRGGYFEQNGTEKRLGPYGGRLRKPMRAVPEANEIFRKGRAKRLLALGIEIFGSGLLVSSSAFENAKLKNPIALTAVGASFTVGSFLLDRRGRRQIDSAIEAHNRIILQK